MFQSKWKNRSQSPTYYSWKAMRARCYDPAHTAYSSYGGRGIVVCDKWKDDYDAFVEDMGLRADKMTLERIDGNGDYTPNNCKWASRKEQARNRNTNQFITYQEQTKTLTDWASELGISPNTLKTRIGSGIPINEAMTSKWRREVEAPHGSVSRYTNRKCKCDLCIKAWRQYQRDYRRKKR